MPLERCARASSNFQQYLTRAYNKVAYVDTEGTFRPDRIRSIAERFGVDGDMALENILYGAELAYPRLVSLADLTPVYISSGLQQRTSGRKTFVRLDTAAQGG